MHSRRPITLGEALEYRDLVRALIEALRPAISKLEAELVAPLPECIKANELSEYGQVLLGKKQSQESGIQKKIGTMCHRGVWQTLGRYENYHYKSIRRVS